MPGITTPTEPYFKDGVWGWDGTVWRKLPLVWGFSDTYGESADDMNVAAGDRFKNYGPVPAGEVWVVTFFQVTPVQANITRLQLGANVGGVSCALLETGTIVADESIGVSGQIILAKDDYLFYYYAGALVNDDFYSSAVGYKMKIAE